LCDDTGAMDMVHFGKWWGQVHLFVVHTISTAEIVEMLKYLVKDNVQKNCEWEGQGEGGVAAEVEGGVVDVVDVQVEGQVQGEVEGQVQGEVKGQV